MKCRDVGLVLLFIRLLGLVSPETIYVTRIDLKPGTYVLACFYGSAGSRGREHTMLGMERAVQVR